MSARSLSLPVVACSESTVRGNYQDYVPAAWVNLKSRESWLRAIGTAHAALRGTSTLDAMRMFVAESQKLPHFGCACFSAESKRDQEAAYLLIGVDGILVVRRKDGALLSHYPLAALLTCAARALPPRRPSRASLGGATSPPPR